MFTLQSSRSERIGLAKPPKSSLNNAKICAREYHESFEDSSLMVSNVLVAARRPLIAHLHLAKSVVERNFDSVLPGWHRHIPVEIDERCSNEDRVSGQATQRELAVCVAERNGCRPVVQ